MYTHKQVQLVDSEGGGVGGGVSKCSPQADFKLPATPRKQRSPHDEGLYIYKYMCVCVSRSCLAHTVLTCMEYWSRGFGEAFLCSPPADFKPPATPRKHRCSQDEGLYIYI